MGRSLSQDGKLVRERGARVFKRRRIKEEEGKAIEGERVAGRKFHHSSSCCQCSLAVACQPDFCYEKENNWTGRTDLLCLGCVIIQGALFLLLLLFLLLPLLIRQESEEASKDLFHQLQSIQIYLFIYFYVSQIARPCISLPPHVRAV